jgi:hypothetical protein
MSFKILQVGVENGESDARNHIWGLRPMWVKAEASMKSGGIRRVVGFDHGFAGCRAARALKVFGLILLVTIFGCGPHSDRLALSGAVTLDGTPLDSGSIRFSSTGGSKMYAVGGVIKDGEFRIPQDKGLPPGTYRVEISAPDEKSPPKYQRFAPGEPGMMTRPDRIPPDFNLESKHTIDVSASSDNHFVFDVVNKRTK